MTPETLHALLKVEGPALRSQCACPKTPQVPLHTSSLSHCPVTTHETIHFISLLEPQTKKLLSLIPHPSPGDTVRSSGLLKGFWGVSGLHLPGAFTRVESTQANRYPGCGSILSPHQVTLRPSVLRRPRDSISGSPVTTQSVPSGQDGSRDSGGVPGNQAPGRDRAWCLAGRGPSAWIS